MVLSPDLTNTLGAKIMSDREHTEKVRQEIMRFNELLGIMRGHLTAGERAYDALFASFTPEERENTKHKDLQWKLAEQMTDLTSLSRAVSNMRFASRELEKAFSELQDIIASTEDVTE
jgi:hypothetical protein